MARVYFRTFLLCIVLAVVTVVYQYKTVNAVKSRRMRQSIMDVSDSASDPLVYPTEENILKSEPKDEPLNDHNSVNHNVHAFYYPWYASNAIDGEWAHWNHPILPHWVARVNAQFPIGKVHRAPDDIGSTFYPSLGPYSSADPSVVTQHLRWAAEAGIGTLSVSYFAKGRTDDNGKPFEHVVALLFEKAEDFGLKIAFHLEPYHDRTAKSVAEDIRLTLKEYGHHPSVAKINGKVVFYVYDSYQIESLEWAKAFSTLDGTAYVIGLVVEYRHVQDIIAGKFDAAYTYFVADGFSYGCTTKNWARIRKELAVNEIDFIPSVGPGYDDTSIRPWNVANSKSRSNGDYYMNYWTAALEVSPKVVTITSFNEWHEGTQIEPAKSFTSTVDRAYGAAEYPTYADPTEYLKLTRTLIDQFEL